MAYDVTNIIHTAPMVKLGELITECDLRNSDNTYTLNDVVGISTDKKFITTKANLDDVSLSSYKVVKPREFAYVADTSRRGDKIALALNTMEQSVLISSIYTSFRCKDENKLLPEYLYLLLIRTEFDRIARFNSWGSARETYMFSDLGRYEIPLPAIEVQREYVAAYRSLQQLAEQNEALAATLQDAYTSLVIQCANKYDLIPLGKYIDPKDERNTNLEIRLSQGISNLKRFQDPKQVAANSASDKIVRHGQFAYNRATTRNGEKISIAYRDGEDCTVSSAYQVFEIKDENVLGPHFLLMWFTRSEFDRYARYKSEGSAHEFFDFSAMQRVMIPLPPIEVQRSIVALYNCAEEARAIAKEAREQLKILAPAMVQRAANTPVEV